MAELCLTIPELALRLGVSRRTAERMVRRAQTDPDALPVVRVMRTRGHGARVAQLAVMWPVPNI